MFTSVATPLHLSLSSSKVSLCVHINSLSYQSKLLLQSVKISFHPPRLPGPDGQEVVLVTIPKFSSTQTACLVNLRTLECEPVSFSAFSAGADEESEMNISH